MQDTYEDYIKFFYNSLTPNIYEFIEEDSHLTKSRNNIAYIISADLHEDNKFCLELLKLSENTETIQNTCHEIYSAFKTTNKITQKSIYHCFIKQNHWQKPLYKDMFYTLQNLKNQLVKDKVECISMPNFEDPINQFKYVKLKNMIQFIFRNTKSKIVIPLGKIVTPADDDIPQILKENHNDPIGGHGGFHRTYNRIRSMFSWPKMKKDIKKYIKSCESCQKNKTLRKTYKAPMEITSTASEPFEKLCLDVVGPLPITEKGNRFIITMQDDLTKFSLAYPVPNHEAATIAEILLQFVSHFGIPNSILSDQDADFTSKLLKEFSKLLHIKQVRTTAFHPQSNGALERSHSTLKDYLKHYLNSSLNNWDDWIPTAIFSYNTAVHNTTKFSPFELLFGHKPKLPSSLYQEPEFKYTYDNYVDQLKLRLLTSQKIARENIIKSKLNSKERYDKKLNNPDYEVGQMVYLQNNSTRLGKKLSPNYDGPYQIIKLHNNQNITLRIKGKDVKVHRNRLKPSN